MNPEQIQLIKESWTKVQPIAETAAQLFYGRLFELDPQAKALFHGDIQEQGKKLMTTIGVVVNTLDRLETIIPSVEKLAINHVQYGVQPQHYDTVGEALLWTLEQGLGDAFTAELKEAWIAAYSILSTTMKNAAYPEVAA